ncbi:two-component system OmpR family response regulator [Xanthobacter flavus]|uniref:Regulatory protein VirG n=1 Tax=Xanthobacter flavus TaxID=281 RepID=A0A9W6CR91_XANFL|nr:response regulator [Xanthobacter flavus]MBN8917335.1 response regulator [Hyphomicrobiales bacterium]MDR6335562.1 two-component system OmpR family response regulator [Xanthobacter flavus]GLI24762.1 DNA-binding response regulator [Xanthobacter flavus]
MSPEGHILIVDDDAEIRRLAGKFLREHGHKVTSAQDAREMREAMAAGPVDLIILDIMLPGVSGLDLCRDLRRSSNVPIIMLTARGSDVDRIVGLELGADDYLAKPFNPRELLARIHAVLRRTRPSDAVPTVGGSNLKFSGWTLDTRRRELTNPEGAVVDLSTGEYDLLLTFLEHPQRVLNRDQLMDAAKNRTATGFDRAIDIQVSRLRKKLESHGTLEMVKTVRGAGYFFAPEVERS